MQKIEFLEDFRASITAFDYYSPDLKNITKNYRRGCRVKIEKIWTTRGEDTVDIDLPIKRDSDAIAWKRIFGVPKTAFKLIE